MLCDSRLCIDDQLRAPVIGIRDGGQPSQVDPTGWSALRAIHQSLLSVQRHVMGKAIQVDEAIANMQLALSQGQPLNSEQFIETISAAAGVRRTRAKRGRPRKVSPNGSDVEQADFGF